MLRHSLWLCVAVCILQADAAVLDEEGNDLSEFLPAAAAQHDDTTSPGTKRAAPDAGGYDSSSSSEDEAPAADAESDVAAAAVERRQPQVIFCSRTHSQLSQFVGELHRTRFGSSILLVAVASRKALCVNDEVRTQQGDGVGLLCHVCVWHL